MTADARPARACRPTHTSDGTSLFCRALTFAAHMMSEHIWSTSTPSRTWAAERATSLSPGANSDAVLDSPLTAVAWPARKLAMFGLLSGVRAHFGRCVVSRSRLGELPYDALTLKTRRAIGVDLPDRMTLSRPAARHGPADP